MSNLQYIGARYVPKFYLNPDDGSNVWKSGVLYEALTIVTYNNDSYTSKIVVPDSVGNPADNPQYWACTTKYTAALVALQTTVADDENRLDVLEALASGFVTPEMYGAKGDGVTDDSAAISEASKHGVIIGNPTSTYFIGSPCTIKNNIFNCKLKISVLVAHVKIEGKTFAYNDVCVDLENYTVDLGRGNVSLLLQSSKGAKVVGNVFHDMINVLDVIECENILFANNQFRHIVSTDNPVGVNGYGILLYRSENVLIENNIFENVYRHSIYVTVSESMPSGVNKDLHIVGNIFTAPENADITWLTGYEASIRVRSATRCVIEANKFSEVINATTFTGQTTNGVPTTCIDCSFVNNDVSAISKHNANTKAIIDTTNESASDLIPVLTIAGNHVSNSEIPFVNLDAVLVANIIDNTFESESLANSNAIIYNNPSSVVSDLVLNGNKFTTVGNQTQIVRIAQTSKLNLYMSNNMFAAPFFSAIAVGTWVNKATLKANAVTIGVVADTSYEDLFSLQDFNQSELIIRALRSSESVLSQPTGLYWSSGSQDTPTGASPYGFVIMIDYGGTNKKAIYTDYSNNVMYYNTYNAGAWGGWYKMTPTAI